LAHLIGYTAGQVVEYWLANGSLLAEKSYSMARFAIAGYGRALNRSIASLSEAPRLDPRQTEGKI
jgi:hypothetical protein